MFAAIHVFNYNWKNLFEMKEYKFIPSKIFIIIATIILISANSTKAGKEVSRKPNLIFILADDLG